ncbi:MFS transporter [Marininema mesophilum]|uniref:MFS transporter n=1 Tax=Marininema mesophilum TaxID=1048340 RepID=UPI001FDED3F3|nr:nitrate/nitrite transporter [Marininema mesophilum]
MSLRGFLKSGHWPTLLGSFLYFDTSFMVWVLMGATSVFVAEDFGLSASQKGILVALPILGGAFFRLFLGVMADRIGARKASIMGMVLSMIPLLLLWLAGRTLPEVYAYGFLLGIAGASFAAALPLTSRWYPKKYQGLAMGIAGAGNSGTLLSTLFAPRLAEAFGWHAVFGIAMLPMALVLGTFMIIAKAPPQQAEVKKTASYLTVLKVPEAWLFCFFYSITFGGFVGMSSFLPVFFRDQYGLAPITVGDYVTICVLAGSFVRPFGGWIADRVGGISVLKVLFGCIALLFVGVALLMPFYAEMIVLFLVMAALGLGNGAVFQLVPQRFGHEIGVMTGLVGAAGGVGGFLLPTLLGVLKGWSGTFASGYVLVGGIALVAGVVIHLMGKQWQRKNKDSMEKVTSSPLAALRNS